MRAAACGRKRNSASSSSLSVTLYVDQAPAITSAAKATFLTGVVGQTFKITTKGYPAATISSSALPSGLLLTDNQNGTATISGTPTVSGGFAITITATNGVGKAATQTLTLTLAVPPTITSAATTAFRVGVAGGFTPTATPSSTFSESGKLPAGVVFIGGKLTGTPRAGTGGAYPITFTAWNGAGTASQAFMLVVDQAPAITSVAKATFLTGVGGTTFTITTTGYGDLTAAHGLGRAMAVLEALTGQLYLVTVIAVLVSNIGRRGGARQPQA